MASLTNLNRIKKNIEAHLKSGDLELVVLPKVEYDALLEKLDDLKDIRDSAEALKEYRSGNYISFNRYNAGRKRKRV